MSFKIDLHTHSVDSPDGSLRLDDYQHMLESGSLDYIAVTDHNTMAFALELRARLGSRIIVGEEIIAKEGEIIGLYLTKPVRPNMPLLDTITEIHAQGGLVYLPHPFETVRKGATEREVASVVKQIDIVEVKNGRAVFQNRSKQAAEWSLKHAIPGCASSDAHGTSGWGRTYTIVAKRPERNNLVALLRNATFEFSSPGLRGRLYPKVNQLKKKFKRT